MCELRARKQILNRLHLSGTHARLLQPGNKRINIQRTRPLCNRLVEFIFMPLAAVMSAKPGFRRPFRFFHSSSKRHPFLVSENGDGAPLVRAVTPVNTMRRCMWIAVPDPVMDSLVQ